jgi:hypothetical protein
MYARKLRKANKGRIAKSALAATFCAGALLGGCTLTRTAAPSDIMDSAQRSGDVLECQRDATAEERVLWVFRRTDYEPDAFADCMWRHGFFWEQQAKAWVRGQESVQDTRYCDGRVTAEGKPDAFAECMRRQGFSWQEQTKAWVRGQESNQSTSWAAEKARRVREKYRTAPDSLRADEAVYLCREDGHVEPPTLDRCMEEHGFQWAGLRWAKRPSQ